MGKAVGAYDVAVVAGDGPCRTLFVHAGLRPELLEAEGGGDIDARTPNEHMSTVCV